MGRTADPETRVVRVYSRRGCHLCEDLIEQLLPLVRSRAEIEIVDIDDTPELQDRYGTRIPVVEVGGRLVCEYHLDGAALEAALSASPAP